MTILLWKVLDNRIVDDCLGTAVWLCGFAIVAVLLPPSVEGGAWFTTFILTVVLIWKFIKALVQLLLCAARSARARFAARPRGRAAARS